VIHLYAFVRALDELPAGEELEAVQLGGVTAVVGPAGGEKHEDLVRHGLLVQELVESAGAVLPARFGERFPDAAALAAAVADRLDDLERQLAAVDGCVELAVRVARTSEREQPRSADGGAYLRARLRAVSADAALAHDLHGLLATHARDSVVAEPTVSQLLHDACYLVEREDLDEFTRSVEGYASRHPELSLVCTGPWAPASFAGAA
jgi:Gas vesicle synthesis protein GvpL/GvpF